MDTNGDTKMLLIKDLSSRLPYGVKVINTADGLNEICELDSIITSRKYKDKIFVSLTLPDDSVMTGIESIKPYLRPISSMTEEEMDALFDILYIDKEGKDDDWIKINDACGIAFFLPTGRYIEEIDKALNYLRSIHIDIVDLIKRGLALEAPVDMYN